MIPIRLTLRNFMCYRGTMEPLSFEGFHIACLCGDNGSGKSALLDAITWALWGEARAKSDDDLVHQGESDMEVEFDFSVNGARYRIIRKHTKPQARRQGLTVLELQSARGDGFAPIRGDSLRETQKSILDILRMDYQTFVNSSFLLQGRADSFTVTQPARRKELLAGILGLSLYDDLEEKAKAQAKEQEKCCLEFSGELRSLDGELARRPAYEADLARLVPELEASETRAATQEEAVKALRQQRDALEGKRQQLAGVEDQIKRSDQQMADWTKQVGMHRTRVERYQTVLERRAEIESGQRQLAELKQANLEFDRKLKLSLELSQQRNQIETIIEKARGGLSGEQQMLKMRIKERVDRSAAIPRLKEQLAKAHASLAELEKGEAELAVARENALKALNDSHRLKSEQDRLDAEMKELKERLAMLARGESHCPLCETELGVEGRAHLVGKLQAEAQEKGRLLRASQSGWQQSTQVYQKLTKEAATKEEALKRQRGPAERLVAGLEKDLGLAEQAASELPAEQAGLAEVEGRLAQKNFAEAEQASLQQIISQIAALAYDPVSHQKTQNELHKLEPYQLLGSQLEEADRAIGAEQAALADVEARTGQIRQLQEETIRRKVALVSELTALPGISNSLKEAENLLTQLNKQRQDCRDRLMAVQQSLQRCREMEEAKRQKQALLDQSSAEQKAYEELAKAFGKQGIQAMLIETVLPELEAEANRLLGRMTDNRMHLRLESQRQTKSGTTKETLDILISDELGTRDYEMFSGGEAFRINFALRIALAKLLARRAGAPLPTLVIDEGFGTQDTPGKEKLVEAINSIQDDFQKIIVITHIEELKDAFPVRINVAKTAQGSRVWLS